jgi:hypothetical protein
MQKKDLDGLRAEAGFFEARQLVEKGAEALRQARERLRLTAGSTSSHAGDASEALRLVDPIVDELYRASRFLAPAAGAPRREDAPGATAAPPQPPAPAAPAPDGGTQ